MNVWTPYIGANQIFSLSQHWYVGGSGANLQTAECGWQVYPQKYGRSNPVLFIYWGADDYNKTGCYNMDCSAFVQVHNGWAIGASIAPTSVSGGTQYEVELAFYLYQGNWWLYLGGTSASNAIGYYPTSLYNHGAMASHASEIDYGGFANTGWQHAAYQRDIYYYPTAGGASFAGLTPSQSWPKCYTAQVTFYGFPWYETSRESSFQLCCRLWTLLKIFPFALELSGSDPAIWRHQRCETYRAVHPSGRRAHWKPRTRWLQAAKNQCSLRQLDLRFEHLPLK